MPYTNQAARNPIDKAIEPLLELIGSMNEGDMNYTISRLVDEWLLSQEGVLRYAHLNTMIGVLECAKQEVYRRIAVPYEEIKRSENGEVFSAHR
jgi:hypothetical protein